MLLKTTCRILTKQKTKTMERRKPHLVYVTKEHPGSGTKKTMVASSGGGRISLGIKNH